MTEKIAIIGDSLTYQDGNGATNVPAALVAQGWTSGNIYFYGVGGKTMTSADSGGKTTMQNIADAKTALTDVKRWVIALGTNNVGDDDATFVSNVNTVLNSIGKMGRVYWIGLAFKGAGNTNAAHFNPLLKAAVEAKAGATYCDWQSYIHNGRDETNLWVTTDSTHMTTEGYAIRNAFYAEQAKPALEPWYWTGTAWEPMHAIETDGTTQHRLTLVEQT